jgi:hypothetical protein
MIPIFHIGFRRDLAASPGLSSRMRDGDHASKGSRAGEGGAALRGVQVSNHRLPEPWLPLQHHVALRIDIQ